ncbi:MAG: asparaginase [Synergistaceae bacterium]|nr:asparaginase [Synergistaceae bacterium]
MSNRGKIAVVLAGGQIGLKYNPESRGWQPADAEEDMMSWLAPEMAEKVFFMDWSRQPSSHYTVRMTSDLVQVLSKTVVEGADGIVVTCGSDAVEEMAYLTDLYWAYPQPVIFTTAFLPSDSRGSDAYVNLHQSVLACLSKECWGMGVMVCLQDQLFSASEMVQTANHRRNGFSAPDRGPVAQFIGDKVYVIRQKRRPKVLEEKIGPARDVELLYACLGAGDRMIEILSEDEERNLDGLVIAGFGAGNIPPSWIPHIKKLIKDDVAVVITSRCPEGHTADMAYSFEGAMGRLLDLGVLDGGGLTPRQARLRLAVARGAGLSRQDMQNFLLED